jgi:hypothetical protein
VAERRAPLGLAVAHEDDFHSRHPNATI